MSKNTLIGIIRHEVAVRMTTAKRDGMDTDDISWIEFSKDVIQEYVTKKELTQEEADDLLYRI